MILKSPDLCVVTPEDYSNFKNAVEKVNTESESPTFTPIADDVVSQLK